MLLYLLIVDTVNDKTKINLFMVLQGSKDVRRSRSASRRGKPCSRKRVLDALRERGLRQAFSRGAMPVRGASRASSKPLTDRAPRTRYAFTSL